jgi:hypothetical protein
MYNYFRTINNYPESKIEIRMKVAKKPFWTATINEKK